MSLDLLFGTISFSVEIGREKVCVCEREGEGETNFSIFDPLGLKGVESVGLSPHVLSQPLQKVCMRIFVAVHVSPRACREWIEKRLFRTLHMFNFSTSV